MNISKGVTECSMKIAVVGVEPILARPQDHARRHPHRLVARAADLEVDAVLPLELDLLVVDPRGEHRR
jgi:hypothetical protein